MSGNVRACCIGIAVTLEGGVGFAVVGPEHRKRAGKHAHRVCIVAILSFQDDYCQEKTSLCVPKRPEEALRIRVHDRVPHNFALEELELLFGRQGTMDEKIRGLEV